MLAFIRFMSKVGMLIVLFPLRIFPIKKNRILLLNGILNFDGKYGCNPKYIAKYILKYYPNKFEIIYPLGKNRNKKELQNKGIKTVVRNSVKYYYYCLTSKFFITTSGAISYIPFKKSQVIINTWHGGGAYKKMGLDMNNNFFYKLDCKLTEIKTSYFLSSNKYFSNIIQKSLLIPKEKILEIGMPRNDLFFEKHDEIVKKVKEKFNLKEKTKIILYAPTYRPKNGNYFLPHELGNYEINIKEVINSLKNKFGGEWIFGLRLHPSVANLLKELPDNIINMSDYDDVQELLYTSDILINDYSSIMWDFVQTKKPCFIFANDLEEYENSTGLYTKPSSWPFPLAETNEELIRNINNFNNEGYLENVENYFDWMGSFETGHACEKLCNKIYEIYKNEK